MPYTVNTAFTQFREYTVDLDKDETQRARNSREYLKEQINKLADNNSDFPRITKEYQAFGSFARKTKVRPLNDIDMLIILNGYDTTEINYSGYTYNLQASVNSYLRQFSDASGYVNSNTVLYRFKDGLKKVNSYRNSDVNKRMQAVVLNLISYPWSFDLVPAVPISLYGRIEVDHYLIPDGKGKWIRTDPRRDQEHITSANVYHKSNLIPLIRLLKYWNTYRYSPPEMGAYHLETLIIKTMKWPLSPINSIKYTIPQTFRQLQSRIAISCPDPKQLGPALDADMDWEKRRKVQQGAYEMATWADYALRAEESNDHKSAIEWWGRIFPNFPKYG